MKKEIIRQAQTEAPKQQQEDSQCAQHAGHPTPPGLRRTKTETDSLLAPTEPSVQPGSVQVPPSPLSPQERRRRELEELARLRAEWR
jgi:hypothetical protein